MARRGGRSRPFGESGYRGKGLMTSYMKPSGGRSMTIKVKGRKGSSNGIKNLKGRSGSNTYGGPKSTSR